MEWVAKAVLLGWLPLILLLFLLLPARRAVVAGLVTSWLFLPVYGFDLPLVPNYTKMSATCYAIILGALILDPKSRLLNFKPMWIDIPIVLWCLSPFFTSLSNGIGDDGGFYDGASALVGRTISDALPYLIGRLYFQNPDDAKELCLGFIVGGLVYVPLCLYESKFSPQLHAMVYGMRPFWDFAQAYRWGGWRPSVFLAHGLATGIWMATATAMTIWMWRTRAIERVFGVPIVWAVPVLLITTILCRSTGAILLLMVMLTCMFCVKSLGSKVLLQLLLFGLPLYLIARATGVFDGVAFCEALRTLPLMEHRGASLEFRLVHENAIIAHTAGERPLLGWGGWGRAFDVRVEEYDMMAVSDSLWIIAFGQNGWFGLIAMYSLYLLPPILLLVKMTPAQWSDKRYASVTGLAMVTVIYAADSFLNAMDNPVFVVTIGAVAGMAATLSRKRAVKRPAENKRPWTEPTGQRSRPAPADDLPPRRPGREGPIGGTP